MHINPYKTRKRNHVFLFHIGKHLHWKWQAWKVQSISTSTCVSNIASVLKEAKTRENYLAFPRRQNLENSRIAMSISGSNSWRRCNVTPLTSELKFLKLFSETDAFMLMSKIFKTTNPSQSRDYIDFLLQKWKHAVFNHLAFISFNRTFQRTQKFYYIAEFFWFGVGFTKFPYFRAHTWFPSFLI